MVPLFPPYLDVGSKDLGPNGPVRRLQNLFVRVWPRLTKAIRLVANGNYDEKTKMMVFVLQSYAVQGRQVKSDFIIDGNFGPDTRRYFERNFVVFVDDIPFVPGGECAYMAPGLPEPVVWNAETARVLMDAYKVVDRALASGAVC